MDLPLGVGESVRWPLPNEGNRPLVNNTGNRWGQKGAKWCQTLTFGDRVMTFGDRFMTFGDRFMPFIGAVAGLALKDQSTRSVPPSGRLGEDTKKPAGRSPAGSWERAVSSGGVRSGSSDRHGHGRLFLGGGIGDSVADSVDVGNPLGALGIAAKLAAQPVDILLDQR